MRLITFIFLPFFLLTIAGCGYTAKSLLPVELDSIHVDNFENKIDLSQEVSSRRPTYSYWPGLETDITKAVINEFITYSTLDIKSAKSASLLLKGELTDFRLFPLSYDDDENIEEYRVEILVNLELYDNLTGELMWKETAFMGQSDYKVIGPHTETESAAVRAAVQNLAPRIVERTVEAW